MIDIDFYEIQSRGHYFIQTIASPYVPRVGEVVILVDNDESIQTFTCETVLSCFDIKSQSISTPIRVYLRATDARIWQEKKGRLIWKLRNW